MAFDWKALDWEDMNESVAPHFKVHETLWLPSWRVYHIPSDQEKAEIVKTADAMEISPRAVDRLWSAARAWLQREMRKT